MGGTTRYFITIIEILIYLIDGWHTCRTREAKRREPSEAALNLCDGGTHSTISILLLPPSEHCSQ